MKKIVCSALLLITVGASAQKTAEKDTLYTEIKQDIVVLSSTKETNSLKSLPASISVFSPKNLEGLQVTSIKGLSAVSPNFFMPDYGSKMTSPLYIRGFGARTGVQTVSLYVDNVPYFNPSTFDSELYDIQRVEILRGTQGTLYGRNSMGGIVNIYTFSPLSYQGTNVSVSSGNYGYLSGTASHYRRLTNNFGLALSGYYKRNDGFFENAYTGKKADRSENAGGKLKLDWNAAENLSIQYAANFDFVNQGAFPYMNANAGKVNYDGPGSYNRRTLTNGISVQYTQPRYIVTSTTGYQYLNDDMQMDQDYSAFAVFKINQRQQQHSLSEEITVKSNGRNSYQWSNGIFGFYDYQKTISPVWMLQDGITNMLQSKLDELAGTIPNMPIIKLVDSEITFDGVYRKPAYGGALFHQSTFNDVLETKGLSFTAGLRLDYEHTELNYDANTGTNLTVQPRYPNAPVIPMRVDTVIKGKASKNFIELLPKFVLKYDIGKSSYAYASVSRGYKAGGHNVQMFADLLSSALQNSIENRGTNKPSDTPVNDLISFDPEYSWNYEIGGKADLLGDALSANFALFYMDVKDVQVSRFVDTGQGRMTDNAGKAVSKGFELGLKARPCSGFYLYANYGFSDAKFKSHEYNFNKYISFAPRTTLSFGGNVSYNFKRNTLLDRIVFDANFAGAGRIYWTEDNAQSQGFYGTANARLSFEKSIFGIELWGKNIFDRDYQAFYFESMGNSFIQKGKPAQWGATLRMKIAN
ncbi:MAG: TonB-dependent receptor [Prevotella sp.]|jgi:outer membrane receptor protein involved in Fe transport|nr:TonB-dependent receptor [Prevotella sp.]